MIDPILFSVTFQTITPESAEAGDLEDSGFEYENLEFDDFTDLVAFIESNGFCYWSASPYTEVSDNVWASTPYEIEDYATMEEKSLSIHAKNMRSAKYLKKAMEYVNN